jgi:hypothetical protein
VLMCGYESRFITAEAITRLHNWHNKRICEIFRVTMYQTFVHRVTSVSLQKRTGAFLLGHCFSSRTLRGEGYVARMPKSRPPKRLMLPWVPESRFAGG